MKDYTEDFYKALGIEFEATPKEIRDAYRKAALLYHPDKTNGDKALTARFLIIQEGYEVLSDPVQKNDYDTRCYPRVNRSRSGGSTRVPEPEQYSEAKAEAPRRPKPQPKECPHEDVDQDSICKGFKFDAVFMNSLAKRERRFMYDWNQNEGCRAFILLSMARDIKTTFKHIEEIVAMAKEGERQMPTANKRKGRRFRQQQADIDWPVGFLAHLDDLVQMVQSNVLETVSEIIDLCISQSFECLMSAPRGPKRGPRRGPKWTMTEDDEFLEEEVMPTLLRSWREMEKVQKRIEIELQMAESQVD